MDRTRSLSRKLLVDDGAAEGMAKAVCMLPRLISDSWRAVSS